MDEKLARKIEAAKQLASDSVDGFARTPEAEERINATCRATLNGAQGDALMDYIKSITTSVVMPPSASDGELRMQEGMRRLCGILDARRRSTPVKSEN